MDWTKRNWMEWAVVLLLLVLILFFLALLTREAIAAESEQLTLQRGKSHVITTEQAVDRVSLGDPQIAEIRMLSPQDIHLLGKTSGETNLILWSKGNRVIRMYEIAVVQDLSPLKEMLFDVLPEERSLKVTTRNNSITLSGTVSSPENVTTAMATAQAFAGKGGNVVNLLQVGGVHQVMLEVKVAEISRDLLRRLGVNLAWIADGDMVFSFLNNLTGLDGISLPRGYDPVKAAQPGPPRGYDPIDLLVSPSVNLAMAFEDDGDIFAGFLDAIKENGLIKILSEPTLVCLSGQSSSFLSGGEIPIPVPTGLGEIGIEYRQFGVELTFNPVVLGGGKISMHVHPSVSDLDFSRAIIQSGFTIPAITKRSASTTVELMSGQTFAIAGLVKDDMREVVSKFPVLGDIPILGTLFRSSEYQKNQTELVILVTPKLAKPLDMASQPLPTDGFIEPNDWEFYLLGATEGRKSGATLSRSLQTKETKTETGLEGEFGYRMPQAQ
ncbi:MAG: type II and III secretion system protein family protein [Desulfovermiculus sp.]